MSDHTHEWETIPSGHECRICGCSRETAPDQPKAPPTQRVGDDMVQLNAFRARSHNDLAIDATALLKKWENACAALTDTQNALAARDARIAELEEDIQSLYDLWVERSAVVDSTARADRLEAQLAAAHERMREMTEALEPFADPEAAPGLLRIPGCDKFRRAARVLADYRKGNADG